MEDLSRRKEIAKSLRLYRKIHHTMGAFLFIVFVIVSLTGLLLGWKKNSAGIIHPESYKGVSSDLKNWLPLDTLTFIATKALRDSIDNNIDVTIQRIDARPSKGMVKFIFEHHYNGVQLDGTTGSILQITRRNSDLIENIHDGSILDRVLGIDGDILKLIYTSIIGISLLLFSLTGFWLWYGPKVMRKYK